MSRIRVDFFIGRSFAATPVDTYINTRVRVNVWVFIIAYIVNLYFDRYARSKWHIALSKELFEI